MNQFAELVLLSCIPLVLIIFGILPPRRAVIAMTVISWLFMPNGGFSIPGFPDYSKTSATTIGCLIGVLLFDSNRIFRFRPKLYDLPMFIWCLGNVATSLSNDLGLYDGLSQMVKVVIMWGLPYFLGRIYMNDLEGCRECAIGIMLGGLAYVPLCLWEVRMSPNLQRSIYGWTLTTFEAPRFNLGYRPQVFMVTGLEVGMWMTASTLCAYWLWVSRVIREIKGIPFGRLVLTLGVTTILTKSVGAIMLMVFGMSLLELVRRTKSSWLVLVLVFAPPTYTMLRTTGLWSGREIVSWTQFFVPDRENSVDTRIVSEDHLIARAMQRPLLGWGGFNRSRVIVNGKDLFPTDGYWIIVLGTQGIVGLVAMITALSQPLWLTYRRFPARLWSEPAVGPAVVLSMLLALYSMDCLANAMLNPMYAIILGGVTGLSRFDGFQSRRTATSLLALADAQGESGQTAAAEASYREALQVYEAAENGLPNDPQASDEMAYALEALAALYLADGSGRSEEARLPLARAVEIRAAAAALRPDDVTLLDRLAVSLGNLGRLFAAQKLPRDAYWAWSRAREIRETILAASTKAGAGTETETEAAKRQLADSRNDLSWFLANHPDTHAEAASEAIHLAREAVELFPEDPGYWNTVGAACHYAGEYQAAVESLARSAELAGGGTGFDHYLLAMSYARLGAPDLARECFAWAEAWTNAHQIDHVELVRLRHEAAGIVGVGI